MESISPQTTVKPQSKIGWRRLCVIVGGILFIVSALIILCIRVFLPDDIAFFSWDVNYFFTLANALYGFMAGFLLLMIFSKGIYIRVVTILILITTIWWFSTKPKTPVLVYPYSNLSSPAQ